jgi:hypothetical protein
MTANNDQIRTLAERALEITNRDVAAAARLLAEWYGTSDEFAITMIDELIVFDDAPPSESGKDSAQSEFGEDPEFSEDPEFGEDPDFGPDKDFEQ